jgi:hypothetical protein
MSDSNRVRLSFVPEDTWGVCPGGVLTDLRYTAESLAQETDVALSDELRADRQHGDVFRTATRVRGDVDVELAHGAHDELLRGALAADAWSAAQTVSASTISFQSKATAGGGYAKVLDSANGLAGFSAGAWLRVRGSAGGANDGYGKIVSVSAGAIELAGIDFVDEDAGASVTLTQGGALVNGVTPVSFSFEKHYADLGAEYLLLCGLAVDALEVELDTRRPVTGRFTFAGQQEQARTSSAGSGYDTPATHGPFTAAGVVAVLADGQSCAATRVSLRVENGVRQRLDLGSLAPSAMTLGSLSVTGQLQAYFASAALLDKHRDFTAAQLAVVLEDAAGNALVVDLPRVRFTGGRAVAGGRDGDVLAEMPFTACRHPDEGVTVRLARFAA